MDTLYRLVETQCSAVQSTTSVFHYCKERGGRYKKRERGGRERGRHEKKM